MQTQSPIKILCADDHPLIRGGISSALADETDMMLVGEASNGHEAVKAFREHRPDVTLMDLRMPELDGIAAAARILEEFPQARIVILTTYAGDVNASRAFRSGVRGYLLKSMVRRDLVHVIRRVHAGEPYIPAEIAQAMAEHMSADDLTFRELDVLRCISKGQSNKAAAATLRISEDTVKGHVRNVLSKLRANDRTHAVMIAMERGFL